MADIQKARVMPTIADLIQDEQQIDIRSKNTDLMVLLNQNPPEKWIVEHPFIRNYKYLPIGKVEYLLKKIFVNYKIEVLREGQLFNSVMCVVRVHYLDPISQEWHYHDGVGAQELQTSKDSGSLKIDMSNINKSAVQMALPIAKTIAIKDACDHFGRLFGSDLNRKDNIDYTPLLSEAKSIEAIGYSKERERLTKYITSCKNKADLDAVEDDAKKHGLLELLTNKLKEF